MQNSRSRFRARRGHENSTQPERVARAAEGAPARNGRWTGYHPGLAEAITRARLEAAIQTQGNGRRND